MGVVCVCIYKRKIRTRLDLLSIPQSGGGNVKSIGGIIGCKFIKLHLTAQSGPVILAILCHSH